MPHLIDGKNGLLERTKGLSIAPKGLFQGRLEYNELAGGQLCKRLHPQRGNHLATDGAQPGNVPLDAIACLAQAHFPRLTLTCPLGCRQGDQRLGKDTPVLFGR